MKKKIKMVFWILFISSALGAFLYFASLCGELEIKIKPPKFFEIIFGAQKAEAKPPVKETKSAKIIALCFDDGPRPYALRELLPILKKYDVKANFFLEGALVASNRNIVKEMHEKGHAIENHSWSHPNLGKIYAQKGTEAVRSEIKKTGDIIFKTTGRRPKFFRPPFWVINNEIEKNAASEGYKILKLNDPDIDAMDYSDFSKKRPPETLINRVKSQITSREKRNIYIHVIVFHELAITTEALKILIPYFQSQYYRFVLLDAIFP